ncbi:MAG: nuclear transport factor 2 family protein, partial [Desulfarculaceae bacterium]|nr:nuclear transport factor 2 family protein [Desulfarculaceae bacterium]
MSEPSGQPSPCMTLDQAQALVAGLVEAFHAQDVERLAEGWREDVVIRFADHPEIRGKAAGKQWLAARFARQKDYRLVKTLQALAGDVVVTMWTGSWTDAQTGRRMSGKGMECLTMAGGKIALWEAVFNAWPRGQAGA